MIRKPEELTESIRKAVDHRAVLFSNIMLAVVVAVHTALDPNALGYQIVLAIILSGTLTLLLLLRVFDLGTVNKRPLIYIIFYQIFCFIGLAFISDAATPYVLGLYLVVFVSNLYYGAKGVWITVACFGVTSIVKYFYLTSTTNIGLSAKLNIVVAFFVFAAVCSVYVNYQKVFDWDRARLKETEIKLESSINSLGFGFIITNSKPEITMMNETSHRLLCGSQEHEATDCKEVTLDRLVHLFGMSSLTGTISNSLASHKPQELKQLEFKHRNWNMFITPMIDGDTANGTTIIIQDVTEEYILNRSRDEFFSIASHELRTPLTTIRGNSSMMLSIYAEQLNDPELRGMVNDIHKSSERLITIVNDFLDVSKLESGHIDYKLEHLALPDIIAKVTNEMKHAKGQKKITLKLGKGFERDAKLPDILADEDRITQVMYNIIGNAIKFTENGSVTIDMSHSAHDMVKVQVTDTGSGIDAKMQPLLFHKFQQAGSSLLARKSEGTGLGLYIAKLLVEGMGGKLTLERSEPGNGSTFAFTLPVASIERLKQLADAPAAKKTDAKSGMSISLA